MKPLDPNPSGMMEPGCGEKPCACVCSCTCAPDGAVENDQNSGSDNDRMLLNAIVKNWQD